MDEREAKLPGWAQAIINNLRIDVQQSRESLVKELDVLRPKAAMLERRVAALEEIITAAYRGGYADFAEVVKVFESYGLALTKD